MKNHNLHIWAIELLSAFFILIFVYASLSKMLDYANFKVLLAQSSFIGKGSDIVAWLLPVVELIASLFIFLPATRGIGFKVTFVLMILFTGYVAYMLLFVSTLPCSCGGVLSGMSWPQHLLFNIVLTILSIIGVRATGKHKLFIAINRSSRTPV